MELNYEYTNFEQKNTLVYLIGVLFEVFKDNCVHETSACWGRPFISDLLAVSISIQQLSWYTCVKRKEKKMCETWNDFEVIHLLSQGPEDIL